MLTLSRRVGESVIIGGGVKVTVTEVRGRQVRLAFVAPAHVHIFREEVYERIGADVPAGRDKGAESAPAA